MGDSRDRRVEDFIAKWEGVVASELSTSQSFLIDLCMLLGVDMPHATSDQAYMFERPITFAHGDGSTSAGRIDLYRRDAFVLESKKLKAPTHTKGFDDALLRARSQAEGYARALPANEGRPPFVLVVDVGNRIELYSEFSRSGATYTPFPDPRSHRIALADLRKPELLARLRKVWLDPLSLDPSRESARVTREIAVRLATLARSLEQAGHAPEAVAQFLMRCLFTMFAEDVKLLPHESFRNVLVENLARPDTAMRMVRQLWLDMDSGTEFSAVIRESVLRFNGKLFKQPDVLPLDTAQISLLIEAAKADWQLVEPAIFGTLLERALSVSDRHKLGAHYTPRAYVERLVLPTVMEPLRAEWSDAQAAALTLAAEDKHDEAVTELRRFHHRLCTVRVLDPACGSGNFLYVTLEHLKRLEGEVLNALDELGYRQTGLALDGERADAAAGETVDPHNLLGIELNPRAAAIAEVVLWIGYLQWHFRTRGDVFPPQPVIRDFRNIECRDAVLAYDRMEHVTNERGVPVTRWDGVTMKKSPVTGEDVPDDTARILVERYVNPRKAAWPAADFVVGNPPFIGAKYLRDVLGGGYSEALRGVWPEVPESADFVMYWWHQAAQITRNGGSQRFGLITTNSLRQTFNRRVLEPFLADKKHPLSLAFVIPDHPWVDSADGAAVRIAMTVGTASKLPGRLLKVETEIAGDQDQVVVQVSERAGAIHADLRTGANVAASLPLKANFGLSCPGVKLHGAGFIVAPEEAARLGLGVDLEVGKYIRPYRNGRDLTDRPRNVLVIDLFGLDADEVRLNFPAIYQHLLERVKPERDARGHTKDGEGYARMWWLHGKPRQVLRRSLEGLSRYIATAVTAKHRVFQFLDASILPDDALMNIASADGHHLGILSSQVHGVWSLATGSTLEDRPRYIKTHCFDRFPFPDVMALQHDSIGVLAEQLDAHRKRQQVDHPDLTLTGMYNVLERLRSGEPLSAKERAIHEQGLVSVLRHLHDELDAAVLDAYGWSDLLPLLRIAHGNDSPIEGQCRDEAKRAFDEAILERLVALNAERTAEEARGLVRWLRPEFQNPLAQQAPEQVRLDASSAEEGEGSDNLAAVIAKPQAWPKDTLAQVRLVAELIASSSSPLSVQQITSCFAARGPWKARVPQILGTLVALGRVRETDGRFSAN